MRLQVRRSMLLCLGTVLFAVGCGQGGRIRVKSEEVVGTYRTNFDTGVEQLEVRSDGTFVQDFHSASRSIHRTGKWKIENHFLDGTDLVLIDADLSEDDPANSPERAGTRALGVCFRSGRLALAKNESADWYYERVQPGAGRPIG